MELAKSIMKEKRHREKRRVCKNYFMCMLVQRAPIIILMHSHEHAYIHTSKKHTPNVMSWETIMFVLPCRVSQLTYCCQNLNPTYGSLKKNLMSCE